MSEQTVQDFVYKPRRSVYFSQDRQNDKKRCEFSVAEIGRMTDWHQCSRKPAEFIDGIGFCKQHAAEVKMKLGYKVETTVKYAASFEYGRAALAKLQIASETDATIDIRSGEDIIGSMYIMQGKQSKKSQYNAARFFADDYKDALLWLYRQSEVRWISARQSLDEAVETMNKLARMVRDTDAAPSGLRPGEDDR
jgi:hypothetical protein